MTFLRIIPRIQVSYWVYNSRTNICSYRPNQLIKQSRVVVVAEKCAAMWHQVELRSKIVFLVRIELYGGFVWYILARKRKEKRKKGAPKSNSYQNHKICTTQKSRLLILSAAGALKALTTDQNTTCGKYGTLKHQTNPENSSQKCSQRKTLAFTDYKQGTLF